MDKQFPYDVTDELGEVKSYEELYPGIYFLSCIPKTDAGLCSEYYVIKKETAAISAGVKKMGRQLADNPDLLAYALEDVAGGQKIIEYESSKLRVMHGLPLPEGVTMRSLAMDGMEVNPEYFGVYPVPSRTPWGYTLRHKAIDNGVYWIETDQCCQILALGYIHHDELSDAAWNLGVQESRDKDEGLENTMGYLFFSQKASCVPIFELMQARSWWEQSGIIKRAALENAVWKYYPEYAAHYNLQETSGRHNMTGLLMSSLGECAELSANDAKMISISAEAGISFCTLME